MISLATYEQNSSSPPRRELRNQKFRVPHRPERLLAMTHRTTFVPKREFQVESREVA